MKFIKYILTFIILILLYNLLSYAVALFPSEWIYDNCLKTSKYLLEEPKYYKISINTVIDNTTDGLIINEAYSYDSNNPLESYLRVRKNYKKGVTKLELPDIKNSLVTYSENKIDDNGNAIADTDYNISQELYKILNDDIFISADYCRYYHGYLVLYRPLLLLMSIQGIRIFQLVLFIILFVVFYIELNKKLGKSIAFIFCLTLVAFDCFFLIYSLQQAPVYLFIILACILLLKYIDKIDISKFNYGIFIIGSITCFIDFLTVPTLTLVIPLLIYYLYLCKNNKTREITWKNIIITCTLWSLGYILTWSSKWIICDIMLNTSVVSSALSQITYRSTGELIDCVKEWLVFIRGIAVAILLVVGICLLLDLLKCKLEQNVIKSNNKLHFLFICSIPIIWSMVTFNHFVCHSFMTYRNFLPIFIYIQFVLYKMIESKKKYK